MKLINIKKGEIFTIGETPSYPKLRTNLGYIDMRDKIIKNCNDLSWPLRIMTKKEVAKLFYNGTIQKVEEWIKEFDI